VALKYLQVFCKENNSVYCSPRSPHDAKIELVKRITAIEGDTVRTLPPYPDPEVRVPKGHIWVEGLSNS
jgi:signal peptidase I